MICGILFSCYGLGPKDSHGCSLNAGHACPHEFVADSGIAYQWETDWECDCPDCMDGDFCSVYWQAERPATQEGGDK